MTSEESFQGGSVGNGAPCSHPRECPGRVAGRR
jgi:hypothetical protein